MVGFFVLLVFLAFAFWMIGAARDEYSQAKHSAELKVAEENRALRLKQSLDQSRRENEARADALAEQRRRDITAAYEPEIAEVLIDHRVKVGMTPDMVIAAWGEPGKVQERVLKTKIKHTYTWYTWSFSGGGGGRQVIGAKAVFDDGKLVKWEVKQ